MAKNSKPILSILIEEDKRTKFVDLARRNNLSMGYLVNKAIDRMLETDSIDIYGEPTRSPQTQTANTSSIDNSDIERAVKAYVDSLNISSIGANDVLTHQQVRDIAAATIKDSIAFERLCDEAAVIKIAEKLVNAAFNPLSEAIAQLKVPGADELKKQPAIATPTSPRQGEPKRDSLPDWVDANNRRFYLMLVDNSELLDEVAEAIDLTPEDNLKLAANLVGLGFHKQDGTALDSSNMSQLKKVVGRLKTDT
jgi:hypothetical protein